MFPDDLRYSREHEWVRVDGSQATIGITSFAADELGDIVFVELPEPGAQLKQFAAFGVVESVKAVSDLYAPISGEVVEVNEALRDNPELLNTSPFGDGWIAKVKLADPAELDALLDAAGLRGADRRLMAYSPHTEADHRRMLARSSGSASIEDLFADIPHGRARHALRPAAAADRAGGARRAVAPGRAQPASRGSASWAPAPTDTWCRRW